MVTRWGQIGPDGARRVEHEIDSFPYKNVKLSEGVRGGQRGSKGVRGGLRGSEEVMGSMGCEEVVHKFSCT